MDAAEVVVEPSASRRESWCCRIGSLIVCLCSCILTGLPLLSCFRVAGITSRVGGGISLVGSDE